MKFILALLAATFALSAQAHEEEKSANLIKYRQAGYTFMAWNMGKIKAQLEHPESFDKAQVAAAANAIAGVANSGMGALFPAGTEKGKGFKPTEVKPEFFKQPEEAKKVAMTFNGAANDLAKIAAAGDMAAIQTAFGKLGQSCKGCHDKFHVKE